MKTLPRLASPLSETSAVAGAAVVAGGVDPGRTVHTAAGVNAAGYNIVSRLLRAPEICPAHERHIRRPTWIDLFFDLVFAAAIAQLSAPLEHDYSLYGIARFAFLLALVFFAWFGYTSFSTQFAVEDIVQRILIIAQIFLVAVMAANATDALSSRDAAGFGAAYGGVRGILALQYARVAWAPESRPFVRRKIAGLCVAVFFWVFSALLPIPYRFVGWSVAFVMDIGNSWPTSRATTASPPGATHFPERFGLLTLILLGEFVASVMRGIQSQFGWSFLAASSAVLSMALGFAIWSCYSDGATGPEPRHVRSHKDVVRLRAWIALHFALFLGIGILGVGVHHAIALPAGGHFHSPAQWMMCFATAGIIVVIMGIAATSEHHPRSRRAWVWLGQATIAIVILGTAPLHSLVNATALLATLLTAFVGQTLLLALNRRS
jgi:low temperature requirement protein LtrA